MSGQTLVARDVACPVCNTSFQLFTPKSTVSVLQRRDADFCPYYSGPNPLYYAAWVCPNCGFAALKEQFRDLSETDRFTLRSALSGTQDHRRHDFTQPERSLYAAMLSLQLAMRCYELRKVPPEIRASVQLRLAWMCRYGNDRKREHQFMEAAIALYTEAYDRGLSRGSQVSEGHVAFLIGELLRRLGLGQESVDWFLRAIKGDPEKGETFRMARDQLYEAKECIRFFEYLKGVAILQPLAIEEIAELSAQIKSRTFQPGKIVCTEGEPGQSMFILMRGRADVRIGEAQVGHLAPGQVFGEMSLLTAKPRSATVVAGEAGELLEIDRIAFKTILHANPSIAEAIARIVSERRSQNELVLQAAVHADPGEDRQEEGFLSAIKNFFDLK